MGDLEEVNRLLGEARGHQREIRDLVKLYLSHNRAAQHIDAKAEKSIQDIEQALLVLDNMEEENVENYEIAYRQGWQAAKVSGLDEPPAEEPELCPTCNGSGFIPETGTGCPSCNSRGVEFPADNLTYQRELQKIEGEIPVEPQTITEEQAAAGLEKAGEEPVLPPNFKMAPEYPPEEPEKVAKWNTYYDAASKKSYTCSRCNAPEDYETRFCPNCGASMEEIVEELMRCPECGNSMEALSGGGRCKATNEWLCTEGHGVWWECAKCGSVDPRHINPIDESRGPGGVLDRAWWRITAEEERRKRAEERKEGELNAS